MTPPAETFWSERVFAALAALRPDLTVRQRQALKRILNDIQTTREHSANHEGGTLP